MGEDRGFLILTLLPSCSDFEHTTCQATVKVLLNVMTVKADMWCPSLLYEKTGCGRVSLGLLTANESDYG